VSFSEVSVHSFFQNGADPGFAASVQEAVAEVQDRAVEFGRRSFFKIFGHFLLSLTGDNAYIQWSHKHQHFNVPSHDHLKPHIYIGRSSNPRSSDSEAFGRNSLKEKKEFSNKIKTRILN
jgi:hypothetical protein